MSYTWVDVTGDEENDDLYGKVNLTCILVKAYTSTESNILKTLSERTE